MLVLTRKPGESVMIGEVIEVKVIAVDGESVRLGIQAPRDITVYRQEVYESIRAENLRALGDAAGLEGRLSGLMPGEELPVKEETGVKKKIKEDKG